MKTKVEIERILGEFLNLGCEPTTTFLQGLAETLGCEWAAYWFVDDGVKRLRTKLIWNSPSVIAEKLLLDARSRLLAMSEGVAGQVWRSKRLFWSVDLEMDMCLPRSLYAHHVGFRCGIWLPVKAGQTVSGVVELLSRHSRSADPDLIAILEKFGSELGNSIHD